MRVQTCEPPGPSWLSQANESWKSAEPSERGSLQTKGEVRVTRKLFSDLCMFTMEHVHIHARSHALNYTHTAHTHTHAHTVKSNSWHKSDFLLTLILAAISRICWRTFLHGIQRENSGILSQELSILFLIVFLLPGIHHVD